MVSINKLCSLILSNIFFGKLFFIDNDEVGQETWLKRLWFDDTTGRQQWSSSHRLFRVKAPVL